MEARLGRGIPGCGGEAGRTAGPQSSTARVERSVQEGLVEAVSVE